ncbi:glycoside hydrolase family 26 protein [Gordonia alkanivorans]|uniref:glycoside hydrolase family 26 protein n=1 Tax=Gordonia alkanivorans TaxID=84096 RepID=UPI002449A5A7|nr:glycosyl hydrolase [Gordonia alkanivorans]MDH3046680.1 glycosyl hydrolase [Gordonia alkanivorans]MDJ0010367.1 glycosyl hydrolase [Gordonia alkanivorans]MDJ0100105.1 glycosyl hydrolase [Gordonia alkanivorans]MDJ0495994.1 glycosyl hydrolase [Gordonia alkanivorans]
MIEDAKPLTLGANFPRRALFTTLVGVAVSLGAACGASQKNQPAPLLDHRSWGAFLPTVTGPRASTEGSIDRLAALAGSRPEFVHLFAAIDDSLPIETLDSVRSVGSVPLLSLEPWRPRAGLDQPEYSLAAIASGQHDADLSRWATQLAAWPHLLLLRFAQEMNGTWYPWSVGVHNNTAGDYRAAWSRTHSIISEQAPNVRFVWAPNAITEGTRGFADCYPGDEVVDYLGLDGYNWGQTPGHQWQSPEKLFANSLEVMSSLSPGRPIIISEVGCADGATPNLKAQWIADFFYVIENHSDVSGVVWFQMDKERDWRFNSSPASTKRFRDGLTHWLGGGG